MVSQIRQNAFTDFDNPRYYNIQWMKLLEEASATISVTGSVFAGPAHSAPTRKVQVIGSGARD